PTTQNIVLIMNYYKYGDLRHYLHQSLIPVPWTWRLDLLRELARELYSIHKVEIVHKDLHSGNVLVDIKGDIEHWKANLTDFGLSGPANQTDNERQSRKYGVISYTAPEILGGGPKTKASDIYAFGMIMWELSADNPPFYEDDSDSRDIIVKILGGERPRIIPGTPKCYEELMKKCWDADPSKRPTAAEVFDEILGFLVTYTMGKKHNRYRDETYKSFEKGEEMLTTRILDRSKPRLVSKSFEPASAAELDAAKQYSQALNTSAPQSLDMDIDIPQVS
ncbi:9773_t:CDS:2, partial [Paraglomus occultum]